MLRPACLLPAARLSPPHGLSTSRSGPGVSPRNLGSATRRSDAYRGGTCTRWKSAASIGRTAPRGELRVRCVTTHHECSLALRRTAGDAWLGEKRGPRLRWGVWQVPDEEPQLLPKDMSGLDAIEHIWNLRKR
jgi:hypothetical protein